MIAGYEVTITRAEWYGFIDHGIEWRVDVVRLSDRAETSRTFGTRWAARRFGRSTRRIGKAIEQDARWRDGEQEKFTIGWADSSPIQRLEGAPMSGMQNPYADERCPLSCGAASERRYLVWICHGCDECSKPYAERTVPCEGASMSGAWVKLAQRPSWMSEEEWQGPVYPHASRSRPRQEGGVS